MGPDLVSFVIFIICVILVFTTLCWNFRRDKRMDKKKQTCWWGSTCTDETTVARVNRALFHPSAQRHVIHYECSMSEDYEWRRTRHVHTREGHKMRPSSADASPKQKQRRPQSYSLTVMEDSLESHSRPVDINTPSERKRVPGWWVWLWKYRVNVGKKSLRGLRMQGENCRKIPVVHVIKYKSFQCPLAEFRDIKWVLKT